MQKKYTLLDEIYFLYHVVAHSIICMQKRKLFKYLTIREEEQLFCFLIFFPPRVLASLRDEKMQLVFTHLRNSGMAA